MYNCGDISFLYEYTSGPTNMINKTRDRSFKGLLNLKGVTANLMIRDIKGSLEHPSFQND
jgi:hypothetical protein